MRALMVAVALMMGCEAVGPTGGSRSIEIEQPDAGAAAPSAPDYPESCGQLVATDDKLCALACEDWHAFAALAKPGECAHATCPLLDGQTFTPSVCVDPRP